MVDLGIGLLCVCVWGGGGGGGGGVQTRYERSDGDVIQPMCTAVCDVTLGLGTKLGEPPFFPPSLPRME